MDQEKVGDTRKKGEQVHSSFKKLKKAYEKRNKKGKEKRTGEKELGYRKQDERG